MHLETVLSPAGQAVLISTRDLHLMVDLAMAETHELFSALQVPNYTADVKSSRARDVI
jgi:hypothetical protein